MDYLSNGKRLVLDTVVLDLNGTLSVYGKIPAGVPLLLARLRKKGFKILLLTGDQRGTAKRLCKELGITYEIAHGSAEKAAAMKRFGKRCVAIGNARIDNGMFTHAALSIATLQAEGIHTGILKHVDIIVPSVKDALMLLLDPDALCATLKE